MSDLVEKTWEEKAKYYEKILVNLQNKLSEMQALVTQLRNIAYTKDNEVALLSVIHKKNPKDILKEVWESAKDTHNGEPIVEKEVEITDKEVIRNMLTKANIKFKEEFFPNNSSVLCIKYGILPISYIEIRFNVDGSLFNLETWSE